MTAEESIRSIGRAKAAIDNGLSRVGRTLAAAAAAARWLHAATGRVTALSDAVILLCRERHGAEAASPARAALQISADMLWATAPGPCRERLAELERDARCGDWGALWSEARLRERLAGGGLTEAEARERLASSARLCAGLSMGGSDGLPWAHAFAAPPGARVSPEEALEAAARAMADVVRALGARWPGCFQS